MDPFLRAHPLAPQPPDYFTHQPHTPLNGRSTTEPVATAKADAAWLSSGKRGNWPDVVGPDRLVPVFQRSLHRQHHLLVRRPRFASQHGPQPPFPGNSRLSIHQDIELAGSAFFNQRGFPGRILDGGSVTRYSGQIRFSAGTVNDFYRHTIFPGSSRSIFFRAGQPLTWQANSKHPCTILSGSACLPRCHREHGRPEHGRQEHAVVFGMQRLHLDRFQTVVGGIPVTPPGGPQKKPGLHSCKRLTALGFARNQLPDSLKRSFHRKKFPAAVCQNHVGPPGMIEKELLGIHGIGK